MRNFLVFLCLLMAGTPALAEAPPVPASKKEKFEAMEYDLASGKQEQKALESKVKKIENELGETKSRLVDVGTSVQENEKALLILETRIAELEKEQTEIQESLKTDQQSIARLVLALERIRRVPPEALIVKPGAPLKTAQSVMLMRDIIPALQKKADALRVNLAQLETVSKDLQEKRGKVRATSQELKTEQQKLAALVEKRTDLFASTHEDLEEQRKTVQRISAQAKNLQDLVRRLDEERKRPSVTPSGKKPKPVPDNTPLPKAGEARLPVSGIITTRYNDADAFGASSKGLSIQARGGSLVVAPMGGVVRFSGHFKNYGNMVIIEHKGGYHSLIAGLEKIDTVVGQSVSAGEPLGALRQAEGEGQKSSLYYELRLNGQPVNPSKKFADLG
jgi:septal ring factor EnvC (AmiA/AmiB activator)